ncbi:MAG TPA: xanthine dehydrogenase family protein molybdopterin-binding subunit [Steroidobacteraceae bacterium]|nr:xanthine dehydrogenase family protein molybdopterin-binding subunit [Steroidobacteraceae bacterium]
MSVNPPSVEDATDEAPDASRRAFLKTTATLSGGLVIAMALPGCGKKPAPTGDTKYISPNAWLRIGTDNSITFYCDKSEMGQGVYTALPMLIAEELGVSVAQIDVEFAPPGDAYINNLLGGQVTGGSTSVRDGWEKLRKAGATARHLLVAAAADEWGVDPRTCKVADGVIVSPQYKKLRFGEVAEAAAKLPAPKDVKLKPADQFTVIGRPQRRKDTPSKVDGSAIYGIDVKLPGMLYAALAQSPALGGTVKTFNDEKARAMPGVVAAVLTSSGVAVVADSWWRAKKARDALQIEWDAGPNAALNDAKIAQTLRKGAAADGKVARNDGDVDAAIKSAARVVRAEYELPLLAHATLEPQNCTADVRTDGADIYVPTQVQQIAQAAAAKAAGLDPAKVKVHTTFLGGGFGRRLETDFIPAAVEVSKAVKKPVKLVWTREDDMTHDAYRPPALDQATAAFDAKGKLTAWQLHLTGPSITARMFPAVVEKMVDPFAVEAASNYPYDVPNVRVDYRQQEIGINVGYWRSVSHSLNCFVAESFMDELAFAQRKGAAEFRRELLEKQPRFLKVLQMVTHEARFGYPPRGHAHGLALMEGYGTYMAQVADISIENSGKVKVHRVYCAADCGQQINPDTVVAQIESSILFGYSALMWGEINLQGGRVQQTNFDSYRVARMNEAPRVDAYLIDSTEAPGGIGEPATALVAPAVCNAIFAASGRRLRSLPLARHKMA